MSVPYGPILIAEDIPSILELLQVTLQFKGYPVITAHNGLEALKRAEMEHPALVITDILMPKLDGYQLTHRLRTNPKTSHIPIIFLSATYVTPEDKDFALKLGAARFLEKPVDAAELLLTVAEVLTIGHDSNTPRPLATREFYRGYKARLESKLRHKNAQIGRTERLLETLPEIQKPAFRALLEETCDQRNQIQEELDQLFRLQEQFPQK
jgi:CheY-like chemotaxis protein